MLLKLNEMHPFYTKVDNRNILRLVFAYNYISILKDNEKYSFIPIEGKEIYINLNNNECTNLEDVLVFQKGNRFIRLPVSEFLSIPEVTEEIDKIIYKGNSNLPKLNKSKKKVKFPKDNDLKEYLHILNLEIDYELITLFNALNNKDELEIDKSKKRLTEINKEIEDINKKLLVK